MGALPPRYSFVLNPHVRERSTKCPSGDASTRIGAHTALTLDEAVTRVQAMHDAARSVREDIIVLCHGGPIAEPEDAQYVLDRTKGVAGFFGASSIERLATEPAIEREARRFKALTMSRR
jgi:predicted TIM-barrel enzyme